MSFCKKCGKQNNDTAKFCTGCGTSFEIIPTVNRTGFPKNKLSLTIILIFLSISLDTAAYFIFFNKKSKKNDPIQKTENNNNFDSRGAKNNTNTDIPRDNSFTEMNGKFVYHSDCFVIITGSYAEETNAINAVANMKMSGYPNAGYLWRPDYPSINDKYLFSTFIGPYPDYSECADNLRKLKGANIYWYGIKVSFDNTRVDIR